MITRLQEEKDALPEKQENQNKIQNLLTDISGTTNNIKDFVKESSLYQLKINMRDSVDIKSLGLDKETTEILLEAQNIKK